MMPRTLVLCLILAQCLPAALYAQQELSLDEAVKAALAGNPAISAAGYDVEAAGMSAKGAKALANPEFVVEPFLTGENGSDVELHLIQPLEINGSRKARGKIAENEYKAQRAAEAVSRSELIRDVKIAYWDVVQAQEIALLAQENMALVESLLAAAKRQVDVGTAPGSQVIKADVELSRAKQELRQAEADLARSKADLNILLGRDPSTDFTATDKLAINPVENIQSDSIEPVISNRPEVVREEALLAARRSEVELSKAERRPDLAVQAKMESLDEDPGIGFSIGIPLFDWGAAKSQTNQAQALVKSQQMSLEAEKNRVRLDIAKAQIAVREALETVQDYQAGVLTQSEQLAQMAEKGYKAGATGYLEVLEAQRTLREVKIDYITALADYAKAEAELEWATGANYQPTREEVK
ncbi:MAG TPA: TolC family protein [Armatimonadota bacterium]|nr:TolC family protein [Armatimonadota bacterium]